MNYLSVCAIAKDEDDNLEEWVRYHQLIGVEKFFIFDHESKTPIERTLAPLVADGMVHVTRVQGSHPQYAAYAWCAANHQPKFKWMAFIDLDEFIVPVREDDLRLVLAEFEQYGGLAVNWLVFGSAGHETRPPGLVIENYTLCAPRSVYGNSHVKTIAQPERVLAVNNPHFWEYKPPWFCVNENGERVDGAFSPHSARQLQINHYFSKSREEFEKKLARGGADQPRFRDEGLFDRHNRICNAIKDETILRFAPRVKAAMGGLDASRTSPPPPL